MGTVFQIVCVKRLIYHSGNIFYEKKDQLLIGEKKNIVKGISYTFKDFSESIIFQILISLLVVFLLFNAMTYLISKIGKEPVTIMKGGKRR